MLKMNNDIGWTTPVTAANLDDNPGKLVQGGETLLYGWSIANTAAAVTYVQLFDAAALVDVVLGTTAPTAWIALSASVVGNAELTKPLRFSLGLVAFSTTTATGSTAATSHATFFIA